MNNENKVNQMLITHLSIFCPFISENAIEYVQISPTEIVATLNDGSIFLYDDLDQTSRALPQDSNNLTEDQCRNEFGIRLRRLMYRKGITQKQLSEETGISEIMISNYINCKCTPSFYKVDKIAKALGCSIDVFRYF